MYQSIMPSFLEGWTNACRVDVETVPSSTIMRTLTNMSPPSPSDLRRR